MRRILLTLGAVWCLQGSVHAHDLKVLASRLTLDKPGKITVYLGWGHLFPVDDLIDGKTIERYELLTPKGVVTLKAADLSLQANAAQLEEIGIHQAVVSRKASVFTWIIDADGNRVMKRGPKSNFKDAKIDSAQRSQMFGKSVIVVGHSAKTSVKPVGLPLEIVPLDPPSSWRASSTLRVQVLHDGKPLQGASVSAAPARHVSADDDGPAATKSGPQGIVELKTSEPGTWLLKAQHRIATTGSTRDQYDFESLTTTLVLDLPPR